ncbi:MAG: hypothetical protein R3E83_04245 [Burkholderiaceae bacterium]
MPSPRRKARPTRAEEAAPLDWKRGSAYLLAVIVIMVAGMWSIAIIHARMPDATARAEPVPAGPEVRSPAAEPGPGQPITAVPPESTQLMRDQGWVRPQAVEIYDQRQKESWLPNDGLPPEIAIVPEVPASVMPLSVNSPGANPQAGGRDPAFANQEMPVANGAIGLGGFRPPPPMPNLPLPGWGPLAKPAPSSLERGEVATVEIDATGQPSVSGPQTGTESAPATTIDLATLPGQPARQDTQGASGVPMPGQPAPAPADKLSLAELVSIKCASAGFFGRHNCEDQVKADYCEGRWGSIPECRREVVVNF